MDELQWYKGLAELYKQLDAAAWKLRENQNGSPASIEAMKMHDEVMNTLTEYIEKTT